MWNFTKHPREGTDPRSNQSIVFTSKITGMLEGRKFIFYLAGDVSLRAMQLWVTQLSVREKTIKNMH